MPRFLPLLAVLVPLGLAGCGGGEGGCAGGGRSPNGEFAGSYTALFTPETGNRLDFAFIVDSEGKLSGTVTDPASTPIVEGTVSGTANDSFACNQPDGRLIDLNFTIDRILGKVRATRAGRGELAGRYSANGGSLVVTRVGS